MTTIALHPGADDALLDADLRAGRYDAIARGAFRVLRTSGGRYYAAVRLETKLGDLCAAVCLDPNAATGLLSTGAAPAAPALDSLTRAADVAADELETAAEERGTSPAIVRAARLCVRAHMGDEQARDFVRRTVRAARGGDAQARRAVAVLASGRVFAHEVLGHRTSTGSFFDDIGHAIKHAVRDVSHAVEHVSHDVMNVERKVEKAVGPVIKAVKQWGPMILSDVEGLVSLIPGIGTGIAAALAAAEAILSGGGPLEIALHLAYGAIPIPPGIRNITDTVFDTVVEFIKNPAPPGRRRHRRHPRPDPQGLAARGLRHPRPHHRQAPADLEGRRCARDPLRDPVHGRAYELAHQGPRRRERAGPGSTREAPGPQGRLQEHP